jgi:hypothetical protein
LEREECGLGQSERKRPRGRLRIGRRIILKCIKTGLDYANWIHFTLDKDLFVVRAQSFKKCDKIHAN